MIIFHIKMLIKTIDPRERNLMIYRRDSARISNKKKRSNKRLSGLLKDMLTHNSAQDISIFR